MIETLLSAADGIVKAMSRNFQPSNGLIDDWFLPAAAVAILLMWMALSFGDQCRQRFESRRQKLPKSLLQELCQAHCLTRAERALLSRVAQDQGLDQPAVVFVDPSVLGGVVVSAGPDAETFETLFNKLFGRIATG